MICAMHENERLGTLTGTAAQLARTCRCNEAEMQAALDELSDTGAASVTKKSLNSANGHKKVTVTNRRMAKEYKVKHGGAFRKRKSRATQAVTEMSLPLSSSSTSYTLHPPIPPSLNSAAFLEVWKEYLEHRKEIGKKPTERSVKMGLKKLSPYPVEVAIVALENAIAGGYQGVFPENVKLQRGAKNGHTFEPVRDQLPGDGWNQKRGGWSKALAEEES